jgi:hypothetical protein
MIYLGRNRHYFLHALRSDKIWVKHIASHSVQKYKQKNQYAVQYKRIDNFVIWTYWNDNSKFYVTLWMAYLLFNFMSTDCGNYKFSYILCQIML